MTGTASGSIGAWAAAVPRRASDDAVVHLVARAFLDTYAVRLAANEHPLRGVLERYAPGGAGPATDWSTGRSHTAETAAMVNAAMAHVVDYDDVTSPLRGHPTVVLLPALVALAEEEGADGRRVAASYAVGFEVICKLAKAFAVEHYAVGWHSTATMGAVGAAAGASHLVGLTADETTHAVGIAAARAAGTKASFGTMTKSFQVGAAAAEAVRSVRLAQAGLTAAERALEDPAAGFVALYGGAGHAAALSDELAGLGDGPGELASSGLDVKKYPCCYAAHRALDVLLDLRSEHRLPPGEVERVVVRTNEGGIAPLVHHRPQTGLEAKFSMEFAVATALHDGLPRLATFRDENVGRAELQDFLPRVTATDDAGPQWPRLTEVSVELAGGRTVRRRTTQLRGSAECPLTDDELLTKVDDCLQYGGAGAAAERVGGLVFGWGDRPVGELLGDLVETTR